MLPEQLHDQLLVCLPHVHCQRVTVHIHRRGDVRVPEQVLLRSYRSATAGQPRAASVSEGVESNVTKAKLHGYRP